jgi:hypothetical protein
MVEIYKGELRDMFVAKNIKDKPKLELKTSPEGHVHIKNVVMRDLENVE